MSEYVFMEEVRYRASLLTGSMKPGKAIAWCRKEGNTSLLFQLQEETRTYMTGQRSVTEIKSFWQKYVTSPDMAGFIYCLGPGAHRLCRQGLQGDHYSTMVFHLVICDFISGYIHQERKIIPENTIRY